MNNLGLTDGTRMLFLTSFLQVFSAVGEAKDASASPRGVDHPCRVIKAFLRAYWTWVLDMSLSPES